MLFVTQIWRLVRSIAALGCGDAPGRNRRAGRDGIRARLSVSAAETKRLLQDTPRFAPAMVT